MDGPKENPQVGRTLGADINTNKQNYNTLSLLEAALAYARRGWRVFPVHSMRPGSNGALFCTCGNLFCQNPGKHPRTEHGFKDATTDEEKIRKWWEKWPDSNIGIATGSISNFCVLDIDPRNGGKESFERLKEEHGDIFRNTLIVATGGAGTQLYYLHEGPLRSRDVAPGVELIADGKLVVAPPSTHASGELYRFEDEATELALLPDCLKASPSPKPVTVIPANAEGVPKGQRNNAFFRYACALRQKNMSKRDAKVLVLRFASSCSPPFPESEALKCLKSAWRYSPTFNCTDAENAKRLVHLHGHRLRYIPEYGKWLVWDGTRWRFDEDGEVMRLAKETALTVYIEAANNRDREHRKKLGRWADSSESGYGLKQMVDLAKSEPDIPLPQCMLDADSFLLGVNNGVLDLRSGALREPCPEDYITKRAHVDLDPSARCSKFIAFVERITAGNKPLMAYLRRVVGYMLTAETTEQCMFVAHGLGANGKTTFANTLRRLLGDYAQTTPAESLMIRRNSGGATPELTRLRGARLVLASEGEDGQRLAESLVKQLTGGDAIAVRPLYKDYFEILPSFKILFSTNHKPIIRGDDHAIWRRIQLIPFGETICPDEQDKELAKKLEDELSGILNWAIEGCLEWQRLGLLPPNEVAEATKEYRTEMDVLEEWLEERCVIGANHINRFRDLYMDYKDWTAQGGIQSMSNNLFGRKLQSREFERLPGGDRRYRGLALEKDLSPAG